MARKAKRYELQRHQVLYSSNNDNPRDPDSESHYTLEDDGWLPVIVVKDTKAGRKYVSDKGLAGKFRIVAVTAEFETETEQVTKVTFKDQ